MPIRIQSTWTPSALEWDDFYNKSKYSTYFHGREWAEIWQSYQPGKFQNETIMIELDTGARVLFPLIKENFIKGILVRHHSSLAGTYGGSVPDRELSADEHMAVFQYIVKKLPNLLWRFNPLQHPGTTQLSGNIVYDETQSLDLLIGYAHLKKGWSKGHASAVHKAHREGVVVRLAESESEWDEYYSAYLDSIARWGSTTTCIYSREFFRCLFRKHSPNIKLWTAIKNSKVIAGALCLYSPRVVVYWHGAALSSFFPLRPTHLLIDRIMADAVAHKLERLDFNPSGNLDGVKAFKNGFGAKTELSCFYKSESSALKLAISTINFAIKKTPAPWLRGLRSLLNVTSKHS